MVEIFGESVKAGVIAELIKSFPETRAYREQITEPSFPHFFVEQLTMEAVEERKRKWWLSYLLTIRYRIAPDVSLEKDLQSKLDGMGLRLLSELQTIDIGPFPIPVRNPRTEKSDGVLFYFCNFKFQATKAELDAIKQMQLAVSSGLQT